LRKIIAIGGMPGTGKTTLMKKIIESTDDWVVSKPADLLDSIYSNKLDLYIFGKYAPYYEGDGYAWGTDRLSMAVQPKATEFISNTKSNVLFEGDRLFNQSFLEHCVSLDAKTHIYVLTCDKDTLKCRYTDRGSEQSEQFINGRETKYGNLQTNFLLMMNMETMPNETPEDQYKIYSNILEALSK
jgi:deoxyadenosine/deoxycytidine kinase